MLPEFIMRFKPGFPVAWTTRDAIYGYTQQSMMLRFMVPKMIFIDRAGIIQAQYNGEEPFFADVAKNTRAQLDSMLKSSTPAPKKKHAVKSGSSR